MRCLLPPCLLLPCGAQHNEPAGFGITPSELIGTGRVVRFIHRLSPDPARPHPHPHALRISRTRTRPRPPRLAAPHRYTHLTPTQSFHTSLPTRLANNKPPWAHPAPLPPERRPPLKSRGSTRSLRSFVKITMSSLPISPTRSSWASRSRLTSSTSGPRTLRM